MPIVHLSKFVGVNNCISFLHSWKKKLRNIPISPHKNFSIARLIFELSCFAWGLKIFVFVNNEIWKSKTLTPHPQNTSRHLWTAPFKSFFDYRQENIYVGSYIVYYICSEIGEKTSHPCLSTHAIIARFQNYRSSFIDSISKIILSKTKLKEKNCFEN